MKEKSNKKLIEIPKGLGEKILYRMKLAESGAQFKTPHRCSNCNKEFDCETWDCNEIEKIYCSIECSKEYNN